MTTPRRGLLFHFTHISNLSSIATTGLSADNAVQANGQLTVEVGNQGIKAPRRSRDVPCGPGGVVADYVPFYYAARSPTLGSIYKGNVPTYQGGQADLIYLVAEVDRVLSAGLPFVISDRNAVLSYAAFSDDVADLDQFIDWPLMEQRNWYNTQKEPDRMERRMAEFLVHRNVPWATFLGLAVFDDTRAQQAAASLASVGCSTTVNVRREWYF